jgi:hypothetical protein
MGNVSNHQQVLDFDHDKILVRFVRAEKEKPQNNLNFFDEERIMMSRKRIKYDNSLSLWCMFFGIIF